MAPRDERGMRTPSPVLRGSGLWSGGKGLKSGGKKLRSGGKGLKSGGKKLKSGGKGLKSGGKGLKSGGKGLKSGGKGFKSGEKDFTSLENGIKSGENGIRSKMPRVLLAATGSVAAMKFGILARNLCEWADVTAVATESSLQFMDRDALPVSVPLYTDCDEKASWKKLGDDFLHVELSRWADAIVIAPLSANALAKIVCGLSDDLLSSVVRAWDYKKPVFVAPSINAYMWENPFTKLHLLSLKEQGAIVVSPMVNLQFQGFGNGIMEEPSVIDTVVRLGLTAPMSSRFSQKKKLEVNELN